ncbi:hypothetical protein MsAg5_07670 [Methanosarcinaceae archaeon Ag5]|uniref:GLUG domain-containing protein n=1 Tax=Methanolapillus africanus TaxID=3028297 RepID=A0AAE4SDM1_9EURY|nr:hypothetical protein [Methanosarcinaceae archaeon Ag5]
MGQKLNKLSLILLIIVLIVSVSAGGCVGPSGNNTNTTNGTPSGTPESPNTPDAADPSPSGTGEGLAGDNTIYANQGTGGGSSSKQVPDGPVAEIYSIEDLYDIRNDLSGNYKLMNDLDFSDDNDYDFNHTGAWSYVYSVNYADDEDYPTVDDFIEAVLADSELQDQNQGGYTGFFNYYWTPIGYIDIESSADTIEERSQSYLEDEGFSEMGPVEQTEYVLNRMNTADLAALSNTAFKTSFTGSFDGNGKTISQFKDSDSSPYRPESVNDQFSSLFGGLFGVVGQTGSVSNLNTVNSGAINEFSGSIAVVNCGTLSSLSVVHSTGCSTDVRGTTLAGGISGINSGVIQDSYVDSMYIAGTFGGGGIAGFNVGAGGQWITEGIEDNMVRKLTNDGMSSEEVEEIEGLVSIFSGLVSGSASNLDGAGTIRRCSVSNTSVSDGDMLGGIVGASDGGKIENCYYKQITWPYIHGSSDIGGIAGWICNTTVSNCYFTGNLSGSEDHVGGIVGHVEGSESIVKNNMVADSCIELQGDSVHVGRIAGFIEDDVTYDDEQNYAYKGISISCSLDDSGTYNGADRKLGDLYQKSTYTKAVQNKWTSWDFTSIWKMDEGPYGLPIFKGQDSSLAEFWTIDPGTELTVNDGSVLIKSSFISLMRDGSVFIEINEYSRQYGRWIYDRSTPDQGDIIVYWYLDGLEYEFKAYLDNQGTLIFEDLSFTYGEDDKIDMIGIELREVPPNDQRGRIYWHSIVAFDATVDEDPISIDDIEDASLDLDDNGDYSFNIWITDLGSLEKEGEWEINTTRLLGDYTFTFDDERYNARIVFSGYSGYYLMVDTTGFSFEEGLYTIELNELVIRDQQKT